MPNQRIYACVSCTRRKVKCDKEQPTCSTCVRLHVDCVYSDTPPPPPKRKRPDDDVITRLEQYERILKQHGLLQTADSQNHSSDARITDTSQASVPSKSQTPILNTSQVPLPNSGTLFTKPEGRRYVDSVLWNAIGGQDEYDESEDSTPSFHPTLISSAFLGVSHLKQDLTYHRPSQEDLDTILSVFFDRVDSILRILHKPTIETSLQNEALLFAICSITVVSLTNEECFQLLGRSRDSLISQYHEATQYALLNADFLRTSSISVLQAYTLFLTANQNRFDSSVIWIMVGIGARMAQRIGAHRDGTVTGLNPFDTEMNRRLFLQYRYLEPFSGQLAGVNTFLEDERFDTMQPLNINDEDIWPDMSTTPEERKGATEMIFQLTKWHFVLLYTHLGRILVGLDRDAGNLDLIRDAERRVQEVEDLVEAKYLRFCDPMNTLHLVAANMARAGKDCAIFRISFSRAKAGLMSDAEEEDLYHLAIRILDRMSATYFNQGLLKYRWHTEIFVVWDTIIWLVNYVRRDTRRQAAWNSLAILCKNHPDFIAPRQALAFAVIKLIVRAWDAQHAQLDVQEPDFIVQLRQKLDNRGTPRSTDQSRTDTPLTSIDPSYPVSALPVPPNNTSTALAIPTNTTNTALPLDLPFFEQGDGFDWAYWDRLMKDSGTVPIL